MKRIKNELVKFIDFKFHEDFAYNGGARRLFAPSQTDRTERPQTSRTNAKSKNVMHNLTLEIKDKL